MVVKWKYSYLQWRIVVGLGLLPHIIECFSVLSRTKTRYSGSQCQLSSSSACSNAELKAGMESIEKMNENFLGLLESVREVPYFRYYSVDLLASCEYIPQELFECYTEVCDIYPSDNEDVPITIREIDQSQTVFELDGWNRLDFTEDYFDTKLFPEEYTGYDGSEVWHFIHNQICFSDFSYDDNHWKADFNKAVSGLHAMISSHIVIGIHSKQDKQEPFPEEASWRDASIEFARRLGPTGENELAIENMYFSYMLLLAATGKAAAYLNADCKAGAVPESFHKNLQEIQEHELLVDESVKAASERLFAHASKDVSTLWEARMRCRELLRIMNCVQCNKCRLHGKVATLGLTSAMQLLLADLNTAGSSYPVSRAQLAALVLTLHKFAIAVQYCNSKIQGSKTAIIE